MTKTTSLFTGILLATALGIFSTGCYYDSMQELGFMNIACDTTDVSYSADIVPILESQCLGCHDAVSAPVSGGGKNFEGYSNLVSYVNAGKPDSSILYQSVAWTPGVASMPLGGSQIGDCELALIESWINQGAQNN